MESRMGGLFFQHDVWVELLDAVMDTAITGHEVVCQQLLALYLSRRML